MESEIINNSHKIAQGNTAEIYDIGNGKILKLFRDGIARSAIEREYNCSCIAAADLERVPAVYELTEQNGRLGIVFQKVSGTEMLQQMISHPLKIRKYALEFAAYHAEITRPVSDDMRTIREKLQEEIGWESDLEDAEKEKVYDYLKKLPDGDCLCHCDFHPGNVMISGENVYFLDWMTACKGDACADAARTYLLLRYGEPMHVSGLQLFKTRAVMVISSRIYLKEYCKITGYKMKKIMKWQLPVAAARLNEWMTDHERQKLIKLIQEKIK